MAVGVVAPCWECSSELWGARVRLGRAACWGGGQTGQTGQRVGRSQETVGQVYLDRLCPGAGSQTLLRGQCLGL